LVIQLILWTILVHVGFAVFGLIVMALSRFEFGVM